jgi:TonB family protein
VAVAAVAVRAGSLVNINDVGVIPPVPLVTPQLAYPAFARQQRAEGTVELSVLIDEKGSVLDARLVKGAPGIGLNQAAIDNARRRRYRPATKDGVPVRVYMPLLVKFELPQ